jgi:hypothetical protein
MSMMFVVHAWDQSLTTPRLGGFVTPRTLHFQCFRHKRVRRGRVQTELFSTKEAARRYMKSMGRQGYFTKRVCVIPDFLQEGMKT